MASLITGVNQSGGAYSPKTATPAEFGVAETANAAGAKILSGTDTAATAVAGTVTFPVGTYTAAPTVTVTSTGATNAGARVTAVTATSFTYEVLTSAGAVAAGTVNYIAVGV